jgi:ATP-dependent 26S proteasome regulatory subunit
VSVGDPIRSRQIAEIVITWIKTIQNENHAVVPIVTTQHLNALNPTLLKPHFFPLQLHIPPPNLEARIKVLLSVLVSNIQMIPLFRLSFIN